jgi:hypothetical protein
MKFFGVVKEYQYLNGGIAPKFYLWGLAVGEFIRRQASFWF